MKSECQGVVCSGRLGGLGCKDPRWGFGRGVMNTMTNRAVLGKIWWFGMQGITGGGPCGALVVMSWAPQTNRGLLGRFCGFEVQGIAGGGPCGEGHYHPTRWWRVFNRLGTLTRRPKALCRAEEMVSRHRQNTTHPGLVCNGCQKRAIFCVLSALRDTSLSLPPKACTQVCHPGKVLAPIRR